VVPTLESHELMGIVDGSDPCPPQSVLDDTDKDVPNLGYAIWIKNGQFLLSWINVNLAELVLATVYGLQTSCFPPETPTLVSIKNPNPAMNSLPLPIGRPT
jgi:hypothetical protein